MNLRKSEILAQKYNLAKIESDELSKLLIDMESLKFLFSKDLSEYIVKYKLGYKYPNISGIVRMRESNTEWDFRGGFPPRIYAIICEELKLSDQGSNAKPIAFKSFIDEKNIKEKLDSCEDEQYITTVNNVTFYNYGTDKNPEIWIQCGNLSMPLAMFKDSNGKLYTFYNDSGLEEVRVYADENKSALESVK